MSQDDQRHSFDADSFLDGFTEERLDVPVDPASLLGKAMQRARESWAKNGQPDPDEFKVTAVPVDLDE